MVERDKFLSEIFEETVLKISDVEAGEYGYGEPVFAYAGVPTDQPVHVAKLEESGFRLVDTNLKLSTKALSLNSVSPDPEFRIRFAEPGDRIGVEEIAVSCFKYSRFHLDPLVDNQKANELKRRWAGNYFAGLRGNWMVVAEGPEGGIVGFLQLLNQRGQLIIDLIAVSESARGRAIAPSLIEYASQHCEEYEEVIVGTQVSNIPSLRMYERLGFRVLESRYMFHYHGLYDSKML